MSRTRIAITGIVVVLAAACCALCQTASVEERCAQAQNDAQMTALRDLQDKVFALHVSEKKTVKDFVESTDLPNTNPLAALLQGVVAFTPPRVYGDGECEARVALSGDALRANLKRILEQNYKKPDGEFAKLTFDGVGGKGVEAEALSTVVMPTGTDATAAACVPGWGRDASSGQRISARQRIRTEQAAFQDGLNKVKSEVENTKIGEVLTLGALMASNALVKETISEFCSKLLPDRKMYWPKGIVEVRFVLDYGALWTAVDQAGRNASDPKQRVVPALLAAARERTKNQQFAASGFAQLDGKPVNPADVAQTSVPLDLSAMISPPFPESPQVK